MRSYGVNYFVFDGPNEGLGCFCIVQGGTPQELALTGDNGPGTDLIGAIACLENSGDCLQASFEARWACEDDPASCIVLKDNCIGNEEFLCDMASVAWLQPTPGPTATATPPSGQEAATTPMPTPAVQSLPTTGAVGTSAAGIRLALLLAALGLAAVAAGYGLTWAKTRS